MSPRHDIAALRTPCSRRQTLRAATLAGVAAAGALLVPGRASASTPLEIQTSLWGLYYYHRARDGEIAEKSRSAVRAFQADRGLMVDGDPGPLTQRELTEVVREVQDAAGATVDGDYGPRTVSAVQEVQAAHDDLKADGRAGAKTMAAMDITRVTAEIPDGILLDSWNASISRDTVIARAMTWVNAKRSYSMKTTSRGPEPHKKWRMDCSAFVSMAWGALPRESSTGFTTTTLHPDAGKGITEAISQDELLPGDIMLITAEERNRDHGHVGIFERWADEAHTSWVILEQAYSTGGTARRTIGYPYSDDPAGAGYKPYRYLRITD